MSKYDVSVVEYPAKHLIGMKVQSSMAKASVDCPAIWNTFGPRMGELRAAGDTDAAGSFGVCVMLNAEDFDYWAALETAPGAAVPQGMGSLDIPAGLYAKAVIPNLESLGDAYNFIYTEWLNEHTEYVCDESVAGFEWYPANWQPADPLEIFMAIKKR